MGSAKRQGELWSQAAQAWADFQEPQHSPIWQAMLDATEVGKGTRFLDAGCDGGGASVLAAERGAHVSGLDAAEDLLSLARERIPKGDFHAGDIENLPFADESFDVVFAANSIQYTEDRIAALKELTRVCNVNGRVVAALFGPVEKVAYRSIFKAVGDTLPDPPIGAGPFELSAPGKLESLLTEAGLKVIASGEVDCPFHFPDVETFLQGTLSGGPVQGALRLVSEDKLKSAILEAAKAFKLDSGEVLIQPNVYQYTVATL